MTQDSEIFSHQDINHVRALSRLAKARLCLSYLLSIVYKFDCEINS